MVGVGVERVLEKARRRRAPLEQLFGPGHPLLPEPLRRDHGIDQTHLQGLLGRVLATQIPDLPRLFLSDDWGQIDGAESAVEAAELGPDMAEDRARRGDGQVAQHMKDMPSAYGVSIDHGDHRLGDLPDQTVKMRNLQPRGAGLVFIPAFSPQRYISSGAEVSVGSGQNHDTDLLVVPSIHKSLAQLLDGFMTKK